MNPILYFLYYFLRTLVHIALRVYYSKMTVVGVPHDRSRNPCILVSNHPSTMLDPLNVAVVTAAKITFLANAGIFRNPVAGWLLRQLYCIPIERAQDTTGGKPLDNAASFEQVNAFLSKGGCLYVAQEGTSFVERRLRKLKTGTARIALAAESSSGWSLGLTIQPIGLNYSDPTRFRSEVVAVFGGYIPVAQFRADYEADPVNAVLCLTEAMSDGLSATILDCEDEAQNLLLHHIEAILRSDKPLPPAQALARSRAVLGRLRQWKAADPAGYGGLEELVAAYFEKLKSLKISDLQIAEQPSGGNAVLLAAMLPLALPGFLSHFLPTFFTDKTTSAINSDIHWVPTFKYTAGAFFYPLFIWLQVWLVGLAAAQCGLGAWVKWAYLAAFFPLGLVAEHWLKSWRRWQQGRRAAALQRYKPTEWATLCGLRQQAVRLLAGW